MEQKFFLQTTARSLVLRLNQEEDSLRKTMARKLCRDLAKELALIAPDVRPDPDRTADQLIQELRDEGLALNG